MASKYRFPPKGWTPDRLGSLEGKTYLITGANSGTGFQAARAFLGKGASAVMLNRNPERSADAIAALKQEFGADAKVSFIRTDIGSLESVRAAAAEILEKHSRIDALICNAAIAHMPTRELSSEGVEAHFGTNHLGHFLLCGLLFDRIDETAGRIVMVGSKGYKWGDKRIYFENLSLDGIYDPHNSYQQSKLAQVMFGYDLQRRAKAAGKKVNVQVCHPGASRTSLLDDTAGLGLRMVWAVMSIFAQSAEKGAWSQILCAVDSDVEDNKMYAPTRNEMVGPIDEVPVDPCALDEEAAAKLWKISEEKTGLSWSL